ncbi:MAG: hypothetical protein AAF989_14675, partial [Planctomycetota bacterium]
RGARNRGARNRGHGMGTFASKAASFGALIKTDGLKRYVSPLAPRSCASLIGAEFAFVYPSPEGRFRS